MAAHVAASPASAAPAPPAEPQNPSLEELWEQFPLDDERDAPGRDRSSDVGARAEPTPREAERDPRARDRWSDDAGSKAPRMGPTAVPQSGGADSTFGTPAQIAIVAAAIALLLGGVGVAVMYAGHATRPPRIGVPARLLVPARQLSRAATVTASDQVRRARATLSRPTPHPAAIPATDPPLPDPPLTSRRVVNDLVRFLSPAAPRHTPRKAEMSRTNRLGEPAIEALKANPRVAAALEHSKPRPEAEAETLKRGRPAATEALNAKSESAGALDKVLLGPSAPLALKHSNGRPQAEAEVLKRKPPTDATDALKAAHPQAEAEAEVLKRKPPTDATDALKAARPQAEAEAEVLKRKPPTDALKAARPQAEAEAEVLKRKPPADATALKAKGESEGVLDQKRLASNDSDALHEQLPASREKRAAKPRERSAGRPRTDRAKRESTLRPVLNPNLVDAQIEARDADARTEGLQECEVRWWRGYVKSQFFAVTTRPDGAEFTAAESPPFSWRKSEPPTETPPAAAALRALIESLERVGWTVTGRGEEWFAVRLRAGERRRPRRDGG